MASTFSNKDFVDRLERLKLTKKLTWAEAAKLIGISRAMLGFIRRGKCPVSKRVEQNLVQTEREAGFSPRARAIVEAIAARSREKEVTVSAKEIEAGGLKANLDYLAGKPPPGCPTHILLSRPDVKVSAKLIASILLEDSCHPVLLACMPAEFAHQEFLNKLTPFCYNELAEAAMTLVFGRSWHQRVLDLSK